MLVEHDMDAVFRIADRITVMVNGSVIASDTPDAVRANAAVQAAYLGSEPGTGSGTGSETAPGTVADSKRGAGPVTRPGHDRG
jgi:ABC-type sugar transport system ATPase subunit